MISPASTCSSVDFGMYTPESSEGDGSTGGACSKTSLSAFLQDLTIVGNGNEMSYGDRLSNNIAYS